MLAPDFLICFSDTTLTLTGTCNKSRSTLVAVTSIPLVFTSSEYAFDRADVKIRVQAKASLVFLIMIIPCF